VEHLKLNRGLSQPKIVVPDSALVETPCRGHLGKPDSALGTKNGGS